jgi:hypothetical protein
MSKHCRFGYHTRLTNDVGTEYIQLKSADISVDKSSDPPEPLPSETSSVNDDQIKQVAAEFFKVIKVEPKSANTYERYRDTDIPVNSSNRGLLDQDERTIALAISRRRISMTKDDYQLYQQQQEEKDIVPDIQSHRTDEHDVLHLVSVDDDGVDRNVDYDHYRSSSDGIEQYNASESMMTDINLDDDDLIRNPSNSDAMDFDDDEDNYAGTGSGSNRLFESDFAKKSSIADQLNHDINNDRYSNFGVHAVDPNIESILPNLDPSLLQSIKTSIDYINGDLNLGQPPYHFPPPISLLTKPPSKSMTWKPRFKNIDIAINFHNDKVNEEMLPLWKIAIIKELFFADAICCKNQLLW